jgi:hypothetical protein
MVLGNKEALAATYIVRRRDVILIVVEEVGEAAETNKKLGALLDTTIPLSYTYNILISVIGSTSMKCQSFSVSRRIFRPTSSERSFRHAN